MSDVVIRAAGLGKKYLIGHQAPAERYTALRDVIGRTAKGLLRTARDTLRGRQLVAGQEIEEFWALQGVSFEVGRGEVLGIIGRNGAGKSTLLKVLSRITEPSAGRVEIRGRIASLLEVGTGFHPELTGRENIHLNGAILGMSRAEISARFDAIVAFAEVERFLDTPVKRYSSGMYVRLAFAVAAHLEPEILVIDEVLAVGDAEFQKKCLGKMQDVAGGDGRTVLFVSHNMAAVSAICSRALVLDAGRIAFAGAVDRAVAAYIASTRSAGGAIWTGPLGDDDVKLLAASASQSGSDSELFVTDKPIDIALEIVLARPLHGLIVQLRLFAADGRLLLLSGFDDEDGARTSTTAAGRYELVATLPADFLAKGSYRAEVWIGIHNSKVIVGGEAALTLDVENASGIGRRYPAGGPAENVIRPRLNWQVHAVRPAVMRSIA